MIGHNLEYNFQRHVYEFFEIISEFGSQGFQEVRSKLIVTTCSADCLICGWKCCMLTYNLHLWFLHGDFQVSTILGCQKIGALTAFPRMLELFEFADSTLSKRVMGDTTLGVFRAKEIGQFQHHIPTYVPTSHHVLWSANTLICRYLGLHRLQKLSSLVAAWSNGGAGIVREMHGSASPVMYGTTVLAVRKNNEVMSPTWGAQLFCSTACCRNTSRRMSAPQEPHPHRTRILFLCRLVWMNLLNKNTKQRGIPAWFSLRDAKGARVAARKRETNALLQFYDAGGDRGGWPVHARRRGGQAECEKSAPATRRCRHRRFCRCADTRFCQMFHSPSRLSIPTE